MKKVCCLLLLLLLVHPLIGTAESVYPSYTYNEWRDSVRTPDGYTVAYIIRSASVEGGPWKSPQDLCVTPEGHILLADAGSDRILEYDANWHLVRTITETVYHGERIPMSGPNGMHVSQNGKLYIALKNSAQAIVADFETLEVELLIEHPEHSLLGDEFSFAPAKIGADKAGRIYILSTGCYSGFLQFSPQGEFMSYYGSNKVAVTPGVILNYYWKMIMTSEQRENMLSILPVEYSNLYCAQDGFVYATTVATTYPVNQVKRLNPLGNNTFLAPGDVEINFGDYELATAKQGTSTNTLIPTFVDAVTTSDSEFIFAVDRAYGRVFERDRNGNLIAVFGALGDQEGTFRQPSAIELLGEQVLVLDSNKNSVTVFSPTEYTILVHDAVKRYNAGEYEASRTLWLQVIRRNSNATQAYAGVGRALLKEDQYEEALKYFRLGNSRQEYSQTYRIVRLNRLRQNAIWYFVGIIILAVIVKFISRWRKKYRKEEHDTELRKTSFFARTIFPRAIVHPFLGFQEIRFSSRKIPLWPAAMIAVAFVIATIYQFAGTGYLFNRNNIADINLWMLLAKSLGVLILFCIAQWSVSILTNASGRTCDIVIVACYALAPYTVGLLVGTWFSNYLLIGEMYASYLINFGLIWGLVLLLIGTMVIHELSFIKAIGFLLLTVAGMAVMVFVGVLFYTLLEQLLTFLFTLYVEVMFRL